jgi:hypothetical protein
MERAPRHGALARLAPQQIGQWLSLGTQFVGEIGASLNRFVKPILSVIRPIGYRVQGVFVGTPQVFPHLPAGFWGKQQTQGRAHPEPNKQKSDGRPDCARRTLISSDPHMDLLENWSYFRPILTANVWPAVPTILAAV